MRQKEKELLRGDTNTVDHCPLAPDLEEIGTGVIFTKQDKGGKNVREGEVYDGLKDNRMSREQFKQKQASQQRENTQRMIAKINPFSGLGSFQSSGRRVRESA